jgi:hypothetical protein
VSLPAGRIGAVSREFLKVEDGLRNRNRLRHRPGWGRYRI